MLIALCAAIVGLGTTSIPAEGLKEDARTVREALETLHPGLYRFNTREQMDAHFDAFEQAFSSDLTLREAYLALSKLAGAIRCGHTFASFYNQSQPVAQEVFEGQDKLPFAFVWIDGKMIVSADATPDGDLRPGTEVLEIDDRPAPQVLDALLPLVKGDGAQNDKRISDLSVSGSASPNAFDIYYPLVFPCESDSVKLKVIPPDSREEITVFAPWQTASDRESVLESRGHTFAESDDDLWEFRFLDEETAYLRLGTFVTWTMQRDWRAFLADAFAQVRERKATGLILDIRGNEGGDDSVQLALAAGIVNKAIRFPERETRTRFARVPESLRTVVDSWDKSFFDWSGEVEPITDGFFRKPNLQAGAEVGPFPDAFAGDLVVLIDAANSSSTFYLAEILKLNRLGTLIGQRTGGNQNGLNGGQIAFLRLPNSGLELDIPLIGTFSAEPMKDSGIEPDVLVKVTVEDVRAGRDATLVAAQEFLRRKK